MDASKLIGCSVIHVGYGPGRIASIEEKLIWVDFGTGEPKKFGFPQAFVRHLRLDDDTLMEEILQLEQQRAEEDRQKKEEKKARLRAQQDAGRQTVFVSPAKPSRKKAGSRTTSKARSNIKEEPRVYEGMIIDLETSFATHAEALNTCFGYHYVHYQKAGKDLENGFTVWFPRIAKKASGKYLSADSYWGWVNILSDTGDTITQMDNPDFPYSGGDGPDKRYRIIFARFDGENRYRFIGVFGRGERIQNGERYTRLGTKFDTKTMRIIE